MSPPSPSSALDVKDADQGEQAPRGVEIDLDLAVESPDQHLRRVVVQRPARHVDCLDLLCRRGADRLIIAVADREIVTDRAAEAPKAEDHRFERRPILAPDIEDQPPFLDAPQQARSEERRVGKESVSTGRSRWSPYH